MGDISSSGPGTLPWCEIFPFANNKIIFNKGHQSLIEILGTLSRGKCDVIEVEEVSAG